MNKLSSKYECNFDLYGISNNTDNLQVEMEGGNIRFHMQSGGDNNFVQLSKEDVKELIVELQEMIND